MPAGTQAGVCTLWRMWRARPGGGGGKAGDPRAPYVGRGRTALTEVDRGLKQGASGLKSV